MLGGCMCGAVRYRLLSVPFDAGWCHCRTCQLNSGSPAMAFATVAASDFLFEKGADLVRTIASSDTGERRFCGRCGTPFLMQDKAQPETIDFSIATLDDPDRVVPGFHIFYGSRIAWAEAADDTPRHDRSRPRMQES
ncbi:MAG: GFA family protein [Sphingomonas sp.]